MALERAPYSRIAQASCAVTSGWKAGIIGAAILGAFLHATPATAGGNDDFFETKIRPIIATHCYACHGPDQQDGQVRLDSLPDTADPDVLMILQQRGGEAHPDLDFAVNEREAIRAWIAQGAPWPRHPLKRPKGGSMAEYIATSRTEHWAFRPVEAPAPPDGPTNPIDAYVSARLDGVGLEASPPASRHTLLRRAYYDLTGLPPTLAELQAFEEDSEPDAFARVVDRLLASPHFGERWGRHWLDVARYSDTKGSSFQEDRLFPFSHTYRDYVIRAFNEDLPYDQFIRHQLAADLMELGEDKRPLAALGFLTLGKSFGANVHDRIDDRIDVVTRGLQGLTVNCARCHDHKFDPIPTADYYALYGVFRSTQEPAELPLIEAPDETSPEYQAYLAGLEKVAAARDGLIEDLHISLLSHARNEIGTYLQVVAESWADADEGRLAPLAEEHGLRPPLLQRWRTYLKAQADGPADPVFGFWLACVQANGGEFAAKAAQSLTDLHAEQDGRPAMNATVYTAFRDHIPNDMAEVTTTYGRLFTEADSTWQALLAARLQRQAREGEAPSPLPETLPDGGQEALRQVLYGIASPVNIPLGDTPAMSSVADRTRINQRRQAVELFKNSHPGRPNRAMALEDTATPFDPYVFERGDATIVGQTVSRHYLEILSSDTATPFEEGSGRLELAEQIARKDNPLTARVFVNRVWAQLFDAPIVGTPSDFGTQGNLPTHPELLDFLAWKFMEDGWSMKSLMRTIVSSATYQQASDLRPECEVVDPKNDLLWRQHRGRLDFEAMRDSLLVASGNLDRSLGGFPTNITETPFSNRRTVYAEVDRHALPSMFRIFDFATPNEHTPMRFETTVPQQALYLMNSPFVVEQARQVLAREEVTAATEPVERVRTLYHALLTREPTEKELALGQLFVAGQDVAQRRAPEPRDTTWRYGYGAVDEATGRVTTFEEFPFWSGEAFQEEIEVPGKNLGMALLNRLGGHPGGPGVAVIRRWTSKADSLLSCVGELYHHSSAGDGIRAYIISSRVGIVWQGDVQDGVIATVMDDIPVQVGDTIDLVVSCRDDEEEDAFRWHPRLYLSGENAAQFETQDWITRFDFQGPPPAPPEPLKPWEQYAQVLLMSNEFMFVD